MKGCLWCADQMKNQKFKGIRFQRLCLSSEDGGWRDWHFATNFMKSR